MKSIWAVEMGEYSNYHVAGVYSTKENAELVVAKINEFRNSEFGYGDEPTITEWMLDTYVDSGLAEWKIVMLRDGTTEVCSKLEFCADRMNFSIEREEPYVWHRTKSAALAAEGQADAMVVFVWAKDVEHAVKIANEHRTRMIAAGEWE